MSSKSHAIAQFAESTQQATHAISELIRSMNATVDPSDFVAVSKNIAAQQALITKAKQWQLISQELFSEIKRLAGNDDSEVTELDTQQAVIEKVQQMIDPAPRSLPTLTVDDSWEYTSPLKYSIFGIEYSATNYRMLYTQILIFMAERYPNEFVHRCNTVEGGRKRKFMSRLVTDFIVAIPVAGVYFEGNLSANAIRANIIKLFELFGINPNELVVYTRKQKH